MLFRSSSQNGIEKQHFTYLALAHLVHVLARDVLAIRLLAEVFQLLFRRRNPEGIEIEDLVAADESGQRRLGREGGDSGPVEDELRAGCTGSARADL